MPLSPPRPTAVPLNALRAFESALRHRSFLRAAEELCVTPGAVAQQIKKLESWAGAQLFERQAQGVVPTPLALLLLPKLETGFTALGSVAQALRHAGARSEIRIAALPAVAQLWLSPRLSELQARMPDANIAIHALDVPPNLERGEFDIAIYPQDMLGGSPGEVAVLANSTLAPVAAPDLAESLRTPDDLKSAADPRSCMARRLGHVAERSGLRAPRAGSRADPFALQHCRRTMHGRRRHPDRTHCPAADASGPRRSATGLS
ncbi:MAG: LysR family transcriptional regulator [Pseudomonadota bacterium]